MLKLSSRAVYSSLFINNISSFIADLKLFLQMCNNPLHHWKYLSLGLLGTEKSTQVRRIHVSNFVYDYCLFKQNVETIFGKLEFQD